MEESSKLNVFLEASSDSDDENLEEIVLAKQNVEMDLVEQMSEEEIATYAKEINDNMVQFLTGDGGSHLSHDNKVYDDQQQQDQRNVDEQQQFDYEEEDEEEDLDMEGDTEEYAQEVNGLNDFISEMEQELSSLMVPSPSTKIDCASPPSTPSTIRNLPRNKTHDSTLNQRQNVQESPISGSTPSKRPYPLGAPPSPLQPYLSNTSQLPSPRKSRARAPTGSPPTSTSKRIFQVAAGGFNLLSSYAATASLRVSTTASSLASFSSSEIGKHIEGAKEAWSTLHDLDENGHDIEEQKEIRYRSLLSCPTAVEITIPARSCSKIPFVVPEGKEISWRFLV
mmetsp:Transcript_23074/g.39026  ORF Transcript_23074/g.39026 Transcript_23074/m.39026 type:complete len:338 (-) Transcript_23074:526-1539(-)